MTTTVPICRGSFVIHIYTCVRKPLSFHITQALLGPSLDLSPGQTSPSDFAQLLAATDGWCSTSVRVKRSGASDDPIGAVAARLRASVVERSAGAASLHAVAGGGGHVALLVKANDKRLKVDVKASDQGLVDTVVAELKGLAV